jgi:hypothetical protein
METFRKVSNTRELSNHDQEQLEVDIYGLRYKKWLLWFNYKLLQHLFVEQIGVLQQQIVFDERHFWCRLDCQTKSNRV